MYANVSLVDLALFAAALHSWRCRRWDPWEDEYKEGNIHCVWMAVSMHTSPTNMIHASGTSRLIAFKIRDAAAAAYIFHFIECFVDAVQWCARYHPWQPSFVVISYHRGIDIESRPFLWYNDVVVVVDTHNNNDTREDKIKEPKEKRLDRCRINEAKHKRKDKSDANEQNARKKEKRKSNWSEEKRNDNKAKAKMKIDKKCRAVDDNSTDNMLNAHQYTRMPVQRHEGAKENRRYLFSVISFGLLRWQWIDWWNCNSYVCPSECM